MGLKGKRVGGGGGGAVKFKGSRNCSSPLLGTRAGKGPARDMEYAAGEVHSYTVQATFLCRG